jgi:hypothetical protein
MYLNPSIGDGYASSYDYYFFCVFNQPLTAYHWEQMELELTLEATTRSQDWWGKDDKYAPEFWIKVAKQPGKRWDESEVLYKTRKQDTFYCTPAPLANENIKLWYLNGKNKDGSQNASWSSVIANAVAIPLPTWVFKEAFGWHMNAGSDWVWGAHWFRMRFKDPGTGEWVEKITHASPNNVREFRLRKK